MSVLSALSLARIANIFYVAGIISTRSDRLGGHLYNDRRFKGVKLR